jgi:L-ascorbate metabolism protein UlaG (beta-lactamase superfamily)
MLITWYGQNCFKLQSGDLVLVTDPFEKESKLQPFRGRADIIIRTLGSLSTNHKSSGEAFEINSSGEYEIKNVIVKGWPTRNLRSVYLVEMDNLKIILLGHLADESEIKNIQEHLEEADILFVPASGKPFLNVSSAAKLIRQLKPALVVPALFDGFKQLKPFLKELGRNEVEPQEKLTIGKKDLSPEKLLIGCLKT